MPVSKAQQKVACIALSIQRKETNKSYSPQATKMAKTMDEKTLEEWCKGPIKKE